MMEKRISEQQPFTDPEKIFEAFEKEHKLKEEIKELENQISKAKPHFLR